MHTTKISEHTLQLTRFGAVNCYLVREDDGFTLIDTGIFGSAPLIVAAAREAGAPIRRIALTHAHSDHAGSLDALRAALPDAEVAVGAREARFLAGDKSLDPDERHDKLRGSFVRSAAPPTRLLYPGDHVGSLAVVAAPGHTPGQIAFYDRRDGTLIVGDAFQTRGGVAVAGVIRPTFPLPAFATWSKRVALDSARQLRALHPSVLAVGHGDALTTPLAAMDDAITVAAQAGGIGATPQPARRGGFPTRTLMRAVMRTHIGLYRRTGGALGGRMVGSPVLLLTTTGRKSGKPRTTPLLYLADGDTYAVVASAGGSPTAPLWWSNLEHMPDATIEVGRRTLSVRAEEASGDEKWRLWSRLVAMYPGYAAYQRKTTRVIPVVVLRPTDDVVTIQGTEHEMAFNYRGGAALITGASSGIGEAFARELAGRGMSVVLVARSEDKLKMLAASLVRDHGIRAEVIAADVSQPGAAQAILAETQARDLRVHLLVNNAGFGTYGPFDTLDPARDREEVQVNIAAVVDMTHAFLPQMIERGAGGIINVASTAAFQPIPYMAVYGASKAFVLSFSEALWAENRARGVRVLALCPGNTATPFFNVVDAAEPQVGPADTPEHVAAVALRGLERGRSSVISGPNAFNAVLANAPRFAPRGLIARISGMTMRPRTPQSRAKTTRVQPRSQL